MARNYEIVDRYGNPVDDDVIPDGGRLRVPMMLRDGMSDMQRAVAADKAARLGFDDGSCRHQLGPAVLTDQAGRERKAQAYAEYVHDLQTAWRTPSADPAAAVMDTSARKTNEREVARLHDTGDAKRDAYLDYVADLTSAWQRGR